MTNEGQRTRIVLMEMLERHLNGLFAAIDHCYHHELLMPCLVLLYSGIDVAASLEPSTGSGEFPASLVKGAPHPWMRLLHATLHPPGTPLIRTLKDHSAWVSGVAVSPDGRRTVSASNDKTLKVWDLETGRELCTLQGHSASVSGVAVSPDGQRAVSASNARTLKVWDLETGSELRSLRGHSDSVKGVVVSPDGRRAVSASKDKTLKIWDLETGSELRTLQGHTDRVNGVAVSPDGGRTVSASDDQTLKVWDLETGRELRSLQGHSGWVMGVAVSADGQRAVSAPWDDTLKVWDLKVGAAVATFTCDASAQCCAFARAHSIAAGDIAGRVHFLELIEKS